MASSAEQAAKEPQATQIPASQEQARQGKGFFARWSRIRTYAKQARAKRGLFLVSAVFAVVYNILGALDIISTVAGLQAQLGVEANPFIRLLMDNFANGWIPLKLLLQLVVTAMILWFPHRLVLAIFSLSMLMTGWVVWNNLQIAGML